MKYSDKPSRTGVTGCKAACGSALFEAFPLTYRYASRVPSGGRRPRPLPLNAIDRRKAAAGLMRKTHSVYKYEMRKRWLSDPRRAYAEWQAHEAAGAEGRPFAEQSILQHQAMFARFYRHVVSSGATVATFGSDVIESFWLKADAPSYAPATRMRYIKLLDRLCRHLVEIGVRQSNPAARLTQASQWPEAEPEPLFLTPEFDERLQAHVHPVPGDNLEISRSKAIVALFLGTGVTAAEGRAATLANLRPIAAPPYLHIPAKKPKNPRTVRIEPFAVEALAAWGAMRLELPITGELLFSLRRIGAPITDMSLGKIVKAAFDAAGVAAEDMSPRILRNTYCRRALLAGVGRDDLTQRLGLSSHRTVDRMLATIEHA